MADFVLKVTTEALVQQADSIKNNMRNIRNGIDNIERILGNSVNYWQGDASELHIEKYQGLEDDLWDSIERLEAYPNDLLQMAGVYSSSEEENKATANSLRNNIIS